MIQAEANILRLNVYGYEFMYKYVERTTTTIFLDRVFLTNTSGRKNMCSRKMTFLIRKTLFITIKLCE